MPPQPRLTSWARRGVATLGLATVPADAWRLAGSQMVMNTATYMVMPFLAVFLAYDRAQPSAIVGTVLTTYWVAARLLPPVTGGLADRIGCRGAMVVGMAIRAVGGLGLAFATGLPTLLIATILFGAGGALYDPALRAALAVYPADLRQLVFGLRNQALNLGVIAGPLTAAALAPRSVRMVFIASAICFLFGAGTLILSRDARFVATPATPFALRYRSVLTHRSFLQFALVMTAWWVLFAQLHVAFPLRAYSLTGRPDSPSWLFLVNGVIGLLAVIGLNRLAARLPPSRLLTFGYLTAALAFAAVPLRESMAWLLVCIGLYTLGETAVLIAADLVVAHVAPPAARATFFGFFVTVSVLGGAAGNYLGTWLSPALDGPPPWLLFATIGVAGALAMQVPLRSLMVDA